MLSEKTLNDPATYMRQRGFPPTVILECAICPTRFQAKDGMAFPTKTKEGNIVMGACCSAKPRRHAHHCLLQGIAMMTRCAFCNGRLGLISHRKGKLRFCRKAHRDAHELHRRQEWEAEYKRRGWLAFLARGST